MEASVIVTHAKLRVFSSASFHACSAARTEFSEVFGSATGAGFGANSFACAIAAGATSPCETMTRTPVFVVVHSCLANASGSRMQPCDAG